MSQTVTAKDKEGTEVNRWVQCVYTVDTNREVFKDTGGDTSTCTPAVVGSTLDRKIVISFDKLSLSHSNTKKMGLLPLCQPTPKIEDKMLTHEYDFMLEAGTITRANTITITEQKD